MLDGIFKYSLHFKDSKKKVTENARQRQENRAVFQLLLVTLGFVIGYFPNTGIKFETI